MGANVYTGKVMALFLKFQAKKTFSYFSRRSLVYTPPTKLRANINNIIYDLSMPYLILKIDSNFRDFRSA